jgi:hypothetical protein
VSSALAWPDISGCGSASGSNQTSDPAAGFAGLTRFAEAGVILLRPLDPAGCAAKRRRRRARREGDATFGKSCLRSVLVPFFGGEVLWGLLLQVAEGDAGRPAGPRGGRAQAARACAGHGWRGQRAVGRGAEEERAKVQGRWPGLQCPGPRSPAFRARRRGGPQRDCALWASETSGESVVLQAVRALCCAGLRLRVNRLAKAFPSPFPP